jgi:hypothetical protein
MDGQGIARAIHGPSKTRACHGYNVGKLGALADACQFKRPSSSPRHAPPRLIDEYQQASADGRTVAGWRVTPSRATR